MPTIDITKEQALPQCNPKDKWILDAWGVKFHEAHPADPRLFRVTLPEGWQIVEYGGLLYRVVDQNEHQRMFVCYDEHRPWMIVTTAVELKLEEGPSGGDHHVVQVLHLGKVVYTTTEMEGDLDQVGPDHFELLYLEAEAEAEHRFPGWDTDPNAYWD